MSKLEEKRKQREIDLKNKNKLSSKIIFSLLLPTFLGFFIDMILGGDKWNDWWYVKFGNDKPSFTVIGFLIGFVLLFLLLIKNKKKL